MASGTIRKATKYRDRDEPNKLAGGWPRAISNRSRSSLRSRHHGPDVGNLLVFETVLEEERGIGFAVHNSSTGWESRCALPAMAELTFYANVADMRTCISCAARTDGAASKSDAPIERCRTAALGGHLEGLRRLAATVRRNSCRDRPLVPAPGVSSKAEWIAAA